MHHHCMHKLTWLSATACLQLQVQQALAEKVWSLRLTSSSTSDHTTRARAGSHTTQTSEPSITSSYGLIGPAGPDSGSATPPLVGVGFRAGSVTGATGGGNVGTVKSHGSFSAASDDRGSSVMGVRSRNCSFTSAPGQGAEAHVEVQPGDAVVDMEHSRDLPAGRHALQIDDTRSTRDSAQQQHQQLLRDALSTQQDSKVTCRSSYSLFKSFSGHSHDRSPFMLQHDSQTTQGTGSVSSGQSLRPTSRLYSAGSALMSRLSRVVRSNIGSGMLQPMGSDTQDVQQLRLSVRIGIATGWLPYGTNLESSVVTERAKSEYISSLLSHLQPPTAFPQLHPLFSQCVEGSTCCVGASMCSPQTISVNCLLLPLLCCRLCERCGQWRPSPAG